MLTAVPLAVGLATVLAMVGQALVGWPAADLTAHTLPAARHTATSSGTATPAGSTDPDASTAPIVFQDLPEDPNPLLARFYAQKVDWKACGSSTRDLCGSVSVPIEYDKPKGATVRIPMRKVPALDRIKRKGTLFINPGGPGASGIEFARSASDYFSRDVRRVWDIVGFDPRGIGESGGFPCLRPTDLDAMYAADPTPETGVEKAAIRSAARARLEGCLARGGLLARNMSSENVARDLDILRAVVGDSHLNYLGVSYGTLIGGLYAELFTTRVGLMVLDSAVSGSGSEDPSLGQSDVDRWARVDATAFDAAFAADVTGCADRHEGCPLGKDPRKAQAKLLTLLDGLQKHPLRTDLPSLPLLTEGWAAAALHSGLAYPAARADLDLALRAALHGHDGRPLAYLAMMDVGREVDGTYSTATFGSNGHPVTCADWPVHAVDRLVPSAAVRRAHPLWAFVNGDQSSPCDGWTGNFRDILDVEAQPATPVLVIGNEHDTVTPIESTRDMAGSLLRSRLVTVDAEGHGAYGAGNHCADEVVDTYLVKGIPPKRGMTCPAR